MDASDFKAWRLSHKLIQDDVAEKFGVSRQTVQNWESGLTPVPRAIEDYLPNWSHRLDQQNPSFGPLTLIYADKSMFINMQGPRGRPATLHQEAFATNARALGRIAWLAGGEGFRSPMVLDTDSKPLWNAVELQLVERGKDREAPTLPNLLRAAARELREGYGGTVRRGPRTATAGEVEQLSTATSVLAAEFEQVAGTWVYTAECRVRIEQLLAEVQKFGRRLNDKTVHGIHEAFAGALLEVGET